MNYFRMKNQRKSSLITAERAKIAFISKEHEKFYNESLRKVRYQDEYHKALCYCLGINADTRKHVDSMEKVLFSLLEEWK